jgi:hypothetical protein
MIKLKEILLNEALDDLYHTTYSTILRDILRSNTIKLAFAAGTSSDQVHMRNKSFFLSTSRMKVSNYARGGAGTKLYKSNVHVTVHLDGGKLSKNHKIFPMDYWGGTDPTRSEQEDRIVSNRDKIEGANRFIKGIHIYLPEIKEMERKGKHEKNALYEIEKLGNKLSIPVYFYQSIGAYMQHRTTHAITHITPNEVPTEEFTDDELASEEERRLRGISFNDRYGSDGEELLNIWNGDSPSNKKTYDKVINLLKHDWHQEATTMIGNDIHNSKGKHPAYLPKLALAIRKSNSKGLRDFIDKVKEKVKNDD